MSSRRRSGVRRRHRFAMAALLLCVLAFLAIGLLRPGWLLDAEFARQRLFAHASLRAVRVGDHRIAYLESGQGPTIVLLHGFTGAKENWLPLMRRLRGTNRVVAPDLPGWGESTRLPGADYGPLAQSERVRAFLAAIGGTAPVGGDRRTRVALAGPPALVAGHSMGGQILGLLAARHPDAVGRIALIDAAGVPFRPNAFGRAVLAGRNPFQVRTRAELHRYLGIVFTDPPWVPWPVDSAMAQRRARQVRFEQSVLDRIGRGPEALELGRRLPQVQSPVLLVWCRDDRVIDASAMTVFRAGLRHSRSLLLEGCGHMPMMAEPDAVAAALRAFAGGRPARARGGQSFALGH
jgi:pimeloyl-ACP methyl ester carboxylesterase